MILFFEGGAKAWVHGIETTDHVADIPDDLVADVLSNPLWRPATEDEAARLTPKPKRAAKKAVSDE